MKLNKHLHQKQITGEGWKNFSSVCVNIEALDLGPHAKALIAEMNLAVKAGMPIVVIILAATIVDVVRKEQQLGPLNIENHNNMEIDWLTVSERKQLDWLRDLRNRLVHYQGVITGIGGSEADQKLLRMDADKALKTISTLLAGFEQF